MEAVSSIYRTPGLVVTPEGQTISKEEIKSTADLLRFNLGRYRAWRCHGDEAFSEKFITVQKWFADRLARSHKALLDEPRYTAVTQFFLSELYGGLDVSELAREIERALPIATRLLPDSVMRTSGVALELNALTGELDEAMTHMLFEVMGVEQLNEINVAEAHRRLGLFNERERQMDLLMELGRGLDKYVRSRVIYATFKIASRPAHMAGLGGLYDFLGRGFEVMRPMGSAEDFLERFIGHERQVFERLKAGHAHPWDF